MPAYSDANAERKFKQVDLRIGRLDEDIRRLFERIASVTGAATGLYSVTAASAGTIVAGDGMVGGGTIPGTVTLDVVAGDGLDVNANDIDVDVTDIIDTAAGITEAANNIQVNLGTGLTFNAGAIILDWSGSPVTIEPDDGTVDGVSLYAARIDHQHAIVAAAPGANSVDVGASAEGAATSFARSDHTHNLDESIAPTWAGIHTFQADIQLDANLDFVGAQSITTTAGDLTIAPAGDIVLNPTGNDILPTSHRDLNIGNLTTWYAEGYIDQLHAGTIKTVVFESDVINVFNGSFMIAKSSSSLAVAKTFAANGVGDTFVANESGRYTVGDFVRLKDVGDDTWLEVTGIGGDPTINVTVRSGGTGSFDAGNPIVNYGASGQGLMMFTALDISAGSHTLNAPGMSIFDHAGAPWTTTTEYVRLGNLNGWGGFAADKWGIGLGRYAANYPNFYVNASDGVLKMRIHATDYLKFDYNAGSPLVQIVGDLEVNGGSIIAGASDVVIDDDGIELTQGAGSTNRIKWTASGAEIGTIFAAGTGSTDVLTRIRAASFDNTKVATVEMIAYSDSGVGQETDLIVVSAKTGVDGYAYLTEDLRLLKGLYVGANSNPYNDDITLDGGIHVNVAGDPTAGEIRTNSDVRVGGGLYVGGVGTDPDADWIYADGGMYINETVNTNQTLGITINQDAYSDQVFAAKSSDVIHGGYQVETDTFLAIGKAEGAAGGALLDGYKDSDGIAGAAFNIRGYLDENADTTHTTAGRAITEIHGFQTSGGSRANTIANGNVFAVRTQRGGSVVTLFIVDEDGDLIYDGAGEPYDEYDDALMAGDLARVLSGQYDKVIAHNREALEAARVIGPMDESGRFMISMKKSTALMLGALGQLWERCGRYERALLKMGASPKLLEG